MNKKFRAQHGSHIRGASPNALPSHIKELRYKKGFTTQKALAEAIDVSPALVSYWENGMVLPSTANIRKLCEVLECSVDDLFDWRS